jgi:hypothetical protein
MGEARAVVAKIPNMPEIRKTQIIGDLDVALVLHVHSKLKLFNKLLDNAWAFWFNVVEEFGPLTEKPPASWGNVPNSKPGVMLLNALVGTKQEKAAAVKPAAAMRELTEDGRVKDTTAELKRQGFVKGVQVKAADGSVSAIDSIDAENVSLLAKDGQVNKIAAIEFLGAKFDPLPPPAEERQRKLHTCGDAAATSTWKLTAAKSKAVCILTAAWEAHSNGQGLEADVAGGGAKDVYTAKNFKKGALALVPLSPQIMFADKGSKLPPGAVPLQCVSWKAENGQVKEAYITKRTVGPQAQLTDCSTNVRDEFLVPFFLVGTTTEEAQANMELTKAKLTTAAWGDVSVPVLANTKALASNARLLMLKPGKGKDKDNDKERSEPPAKKPRRT